MSEQIDIAVDLVVVPPPLPEIEFLLEFVAIMPPAPPQNRIYTGLRVATEIPKETDTWRSFRRESHAALSHSFRIHELVLILV